MILLQSDTGAEEKQNKNGGEMRDLLVRKVAWRNLFMTTQLPVQSYSRRQVRYTEIERKNNWLVFRCINDNDINARPTEYEVHCQYMQAQTHGSGKLSDAIS